MNKKIKRFSLVAFLLSPPCIALGILNMCRGNYFDGFWGIFFGVTGFILTYDAFNEYP